MAIKGVHFVAVWVIESPNVQNSNQLNGSKRIIRKIIFLREHKIIEYFLCFYVLENIFISHMISVPGIRGGIIFGPVKNMEEVVT